MTNHSRRIRVTKKDGTRYVFDPEQVTVVFEMDLIGETLPFEIAFLPLQELQVAENRQRKFSQRFVNAIANAFDWRKVRVAASRRDGKLWSVSGQHCGRAAMQNGATHWPGFIFPVADYADECWLMHSFNDAVKPKGQDKTVIRSETHDPSIRNVLRLMNECGFKWGSPRMNSDGIEDPAVIEKMIDEFGESHAKYVMTFIGQAWHGKKYAALKQNLFAISALLRHWRTDAGKFPWAEMIKTVSALDPRTIADETTRAGLGGHPQVEARGVRIAAYIAQRYNASRRSLKVYRCD